MTGRLWRGFGLVPVLLVLLSACASGAGRESVREPLDWLEDQRQTLRLPALGAVVVSSDAQLWLGTTGQRSRAHAAPVTDDDRWHLGSITKSMTAMLAARLVEQGLIDFDTDVGTVLGERMPAIHPSHYATTLEQLLTHRAGLAGDLTDLQLWRDPQLQAMSPVAQREALLTELLARPPRGTPGKRFEYSNAGYVLAARMLEARAGAPWETLIANEVFEPLELHSAGLGPPGSAAEPPEQPWGHRRSRGPAAGQPLAPGPYADHPPALAPAGTVHMDLGDLGRYLQAQLRGTRGQSSLLTPALFAQLHQAPAGHSYAAGWEVERRSDRALADLTHEGSNTFWFASVWIAPAQDLAVAVVMNQVPDHPTAARRIAQHLLARFGR